MMHVGAIVLVLSIASVTSVSAESSLSALEADVTRRVQRALLDRTDPTDAAREYQAAADALDQGHRAVAREHLEEAVRILEQDSESLQ
jgi:hypothetical protein